MQLVLQCMQDHTHSRLHVHEHQVSCGVLTCDGNGSLRLQAEHLEVMQLSLCPTCTHPPQVKVLLLFKSANHFKAASAAYL